MKGLCKSALAALVLAACGGDGAITEPITPNAAPSSGGILAIGVDSTTGASIETNKDDYSPGEVVHLVGRGWARGETVNLHMTEQPNTHADVDTNVVADASGGFSVHFYDVQPHDLGVTFTLTATGAASNSRAVAVFTDAAPSVGSFKLNGTTFTFPPTPAGAPPTNPITVAPGSTVTIEVTATTITGSPGQATWKSTEAAVRNLPIDFGDTDVCDDFDVHSLNTSVTATRSFTFTAPTTAGTYDVRARAFIGDACAGTAGSLTYNDALIVAAPNAAPTANAGGPYNAVNEASPLQLNGSGSDTDGTIAGYSWSYIKNTGHAGATCVFSSLTAQSPTFTCNDNGTFTVSLTVTDDDGATSTPSTADVTVNNVKPTATSISTVPASPNFGATFTATLNGGDDVSSNDEVVGLQYKFDCGSGYGAYGSSNSTSCTANSPNSQTVKATIKDKDGGENEYQTTVSVNNAPPVANAGGNKNGTEGSPVTLNGTGSSDPDGTINTYAWSYTVVTADVGTTCAITNGNQATASITCTDDGSFTVTLTVTDDDGATNSQTVNLSLTNANPSVIAGNVSGAEGTAIQLSATGDDPGDNDDGALTYSWNVNSAGIDAGGSCALSATNIQNPTVTCTDDSNSGTFSVSVTVSDGDGGSGSTTANLTVTNADPVANAGGPYSVAEGSSVNLNGSGDDPGNNDDGHLTYMWSVNFSGIDVGGTCTVANPTSASGASVSCTDNGNFSVSLQVSDDDGGSHTSTVNLTVNNAAPTADAGGPYSGNEGSPVALTGSASDPGSNDTHTYAWTYSVTSSDPGATCSFSSASAQNPTVTCTDNGVFTVKLVATDDDGSPSPQATATLTLTNVAPVAEAGGPYSGSEGSPVSLTGSASDAGSNDGHSYAWTYSVNSADAGTTCNFSSATAQNPTFTCTDNGTFTVSLVATDDDGAPSAQDNATVTLNNANPTSDAGGPYSSSEGSAVAISGSKSDQGANDTHTSAWSYTAGAGVDAGTTCSFTNAAALSTSVTCTDDGTFTLTLTITDDDGGVGTSNATLTVSNVAPVITTVNAPIAPVAAGTNNVTVSWNFTDPGTETWTCSIQWDVDQSYEAATYVDPKGCSATKTLPQGLYTVTVKVSDNDGGVDTETVVGFVVVYDPNAGFVTGGGWFMSPVNAYLDDLSLTGKANFGFVSKYQPGRTTPDGNTEFQFHAGNLNFKSTIYEWLVVAGDRAQFKGDGTINGVGGYGFLLTGIDGSPDKFRIKIVRKSDGAIVYDNQRGQLEDSPAATALGGGSIVIHTKK